LLVIFLPSADDLRAVPAFPTRRSSDLLRTVYLPPSMTRVPPTEACRVFAIPTLGREMILYAMRWTADRNEMDSLEKHYFAALSIDRKSTRLNSSHRTSSYAVFCLKKKI